MITQDQKINVKCGEMLNCRHTVLTPGVKLKRNDVPCARTHARTHTRAHTRKYTARRSFLDYQTSLGQLPAY